MKRILCSCLGLMLLLSCGEDSVSQKDLSASEAFLANNLIKDGVVEIEPGLQYLVLESGDVQGATPALTDTITAHFHGTLTDGSVFWSSVEMGEPLTIQLSQLIQGCQKALSLMRQGDKWRVFIRPELAYGEEGRPAIPPNSALIFEIELISVT